MRDIHYMYRQTLQPQVTGSSPNQHNSLQLLLHGGFTLGAYRFLSWRLQALRVHWVLCAYLVDYRWSFSTFFTVFLHLCLPLLLRPSFLLCSFSIHSFFSSASSLRMPAARASAPVNTLALKVGIEEPLLQEGVVKHVDNSASQLLPSNFFLFSRKPLSRKNDWKQHSVATLHVVHPYSQSMPASIPASFPMQLTRRKASVCMSCIANSWEEYDHSITINAAHRSSKKCLSMCCKV